MKTIYKYKLETDFNTIEVPEDAEVLTVQLQRNIPTMWVLLDDEKPKIKRTFRIIGTGWRIEEDITGAAYMGTWQEGSLVWHLFEVK